MELLPSEDERAWLLDALAGLIARCGPEPLIAAPILVPTPRSFPDRWSPDTEGVERLARRILAYAGITDLRVRLGATDNPVPGWSEQDFCERAVGCFAALEGDTFWLGIDPALLKEPDALAGVLCHEVAHVWRKRKGLVGTDRLNLEEDRSTDVTTVYLGFGILTVNNTYPYRASGTMLDVRMSPHRSHQYVGALSPEAMSFLLAAQIVALGEDEGRVRKWLAPTQKAAFDAACRALDPDTILERLGLPPPEAWPEPVEPDLTPFPD